MNNKKTTKRALVSSLLALVMCVSMLIGTTFAWFTDQASTSVNTIQSGDLEIALEYSTDDGTTWADAEGQALNFKTADGRTDILWEPGCTYELPLIRVRNNGNLALKYELAINGVTGSAKLLEAIEFSANDAAISSFSGTLLEKDDVSDSILIKGHMKEEAGNEYENLEISGIGITVYATQFTYEKDSYDDQYDAAAGTAFVGGNGTEENPYLVNEASQLMSISDYSEYTYFKVADGVETLDMTGVGKIRLNGSFDGNGVTMNNLTTALFQSVGKAGVEQDIKISNLTANVNTTDGNALVRNIYNPGTTTFENVALHGYIEGQYNMGSFYNYGTANANSIGADYTVSFVNATSDVTLINTTGNAIGGMLGHGYEGANNKLFINMDDASGYTGQMYTTGTATCYEVMAMCSHATYMLNGVETSRYTSPYPSTRLTAAVPTAGADGYYVAAADGVARYVVSLEAQLTAYDEEGVKIANKAGLTWSLGKKTITEGFNGKVFDLINSAEIVNDKNHEIGYELSNGALKVYTGRDWNFASGWITLNVTQYDANDTILATGNIRVHTFEEP